MDEPRKHEMVLIPLAPGPRRVARFLGRCSCGETSGPVLAAGIAHGWHADHVNRFPQLTSALVISSGMAVQAKRNGQRLRCRSYIGDAAKLASELRRLAVEPRRDAEETALAIFERAADAVRGPWEVESG